jgi:Anti-sigma factor NepR
MRRPPPMLSPYKLPGALAPAMRAHFAGVVKEPIPQDLSELLRALDADADDEGSGGRGWANDSYKRKRRSGSH